jgi:hypothetical protein
MDEADLTKYAFVTRDPDPYEPTMERSIDIACLQDHRVAGAKVLRSLPDLFKPEGYSYTLDEVLEMIRTHHVEHHT